MKFFAAILAYILIGLVLGWGIYLLMTKGNLWVLTVATLAYLVAFARFGCLPPSKSH
jgi:hypothetical protein